MAVEGISASISASESKLILQMEGRPAVIDDQGAAAPAAAAPLTATINADFEPGSGRSSYRVDVAAPSMSLSAPAESLLHVFSRQSADQIQHLRGIYAPTGTADVRSTVVGDSSGAAPRVDTTVEPRSEVTLAAFAGHMVLLPTSGTVDVAYHDRLTVRCHDIHGSLAFDNDACGSVVVDGLFPAAAGSEEAVRARMEGVPVESNLVTAVLRQKLAPDTFAMVQDMSPRGVIDAVVTGVPDPATPEGTFPAPVLVTLVRPRTLTLDMGDMPVTFPEMSGEVEIEGSRGIMRGLTAKAADWEIHADGAWEATPEGGMALRSQLSGRADRYTPDLRAALPNGLEEALDSIALKVDGPITLDDASLAINRAAPGHEGDWTRFAGTVGVNDAGLDAGVIISGLDGRIETGFERAGASPTYDLDLTADRFHIGGMELTGGRARVRNGREPGGVDVPEASGECYGGRFSATASMGGGEEHQFVAEAQFAGVRFSPLIADLSSGLNRSTTPEVMGPPTSEEVRAAQVADFSRGQLDAEMAVSGVVGRPETRRGRGTAYVQGGRVVNFPFITRLIEVSNFAMPGNARLDFARCGFYLEGGLITFEDLSIFSEAVQILGYGTMTWPGQILDLRFNSRSARPIPLLSGLLQGIRDQLVTTTVTGKLGEQEVRLQQFPGTHRMMTHAAGAPNRPGRIEDIPGRAAPERSGRPGFSPIPANPAPQASGGG
jgi:hypothetical protein